MGAIEALLGVIVGTAADVAWEQYRLPGYGETVFWRIGKDDLLLMGIGGGFAAAGYLLKVDGGAFGTGFAISPLLGKLKEWRLGQERASAAQLKGEPVSRGE